MVRSSKICILAPVRSNLLLITITDRQQLFLGHQQITTLFAVVLEDSGFDNGIDRAGLLAESAKNTFGQIDIIAGGAPAAILALLRINGNGQRRTDRLTEFAGDTAFLAIGIATQCVQTPEPMALGGQFLRITDGNLGPE